MSQELVQQKSANLFSLLKKYEKQIQASIPRHFTVETMLRLVVGAVNKNPTLLQCTPSSVLNSVLYLSQMGLQPRVNEAYLIPFRQKGGALICTPVVDYRGKIKLARQSGLVKDIEPHLVYEADEFDLAWSTDPQRRGLTHKPLLLRRGEDGRLQRVAASDRGLAVLGYAIGWLADADPHTEVMTFADIERIRSKSKAANDGPWVTDWDQMALKTLVHRLCKMLPQSAEIQQAQELDDRNDMGIAIDPIVELTSGDDQALLEESKETEESETSNSSLADRIAKAAAAQKQQQPQTEEKQAEEPKQEEPPHEDRPLRTFTQDTLPDAMEVIPGTKFILKGEGEDAGIIIECTEVDGEPAKWVKIGEVPASPAPRRGRPPKTS